MTDEERERFDLLVEDAVSALPARLRELLEEIPLVVLDRPTDEMIAELVRDGLVEKGLSADDLARELCGLHTGRALTVRSVEDSGLLPDQIHIFREGIVDFSGGWDQIAPEEEIYEEIRITLLHEIGHHFGLDEDDLEGLGYA